MTQHRALRPALERALRILYRVEAEGAYATRLLDYESGEGRDLVRQLVRGTLQWRGRLDWVLDLYVRGGIGRLTPWIRNLLRLGAYQVMFLSGARTEVVVHQCVELAKRFGHRGTAGLVNAILRRLASERGSIEYPSLEADPVEHIAVVYSHPRWMVRRWIERLGVEETIRLCEANDSPWPLCVRANTLRTDADALLERLAEDGVAAHPAPYASHCLIVDGLPDGVGIRDLASYSEGLFVVQDESSVLAASLVAPQPGETVVDLCAAPGGKTTQLAAEMNDEGRLIAVDVHPSRLALVSANCERLGISVVETVAADGRTVQLVSEVDRVLVDAPCSGFGMLGRTADARWRRREGDIADLVRLQAGLLGHAAELLRPGGRLVYTTCTTEPEEDEEVVGDFLATHPEFGAISSRGLVPDDLLTPEGYLRTWPHKHHMGGSFGAVLERAG